MGMNAIVCIINLIQLMPSWGVIIHLANVHGLAETGQHAMHNNTIAFSLYSWLLRMLNSRSKLRKHDDTVLI